MAISERLKSYLASARVRYTASKHPLAYTAQEIAAAQHVPGRQLAKSVLVLSDRGPVLAVLPAIHLVSLPKLKSLLRAKKVSIGREADIKQHFPDVEVGAMSPFGNLYGVPVVVDQELSEAGQIVFNAGSHTDTIKLAYAKFARLANPKVGRFGQPRSSDFKSKPAKKKPKAARSTARSTPSAKTRRLKAAVGRRRSRSSRR
jgi:Ala-tRNA(Pro) deacylase